MATTNYDSGFGVSKITFEDQSNATASTPTTLSFMPTIAAGFSSAGKDNKLVEITSVGEMLEKYGDDVFDFDKYGQQNLNVQKVLAAGGSVYFCRLLPSDATQAHAIISIGVSEIDPAMVIYKRDLSGEFLIDEVTGEKIPYTHTVPIPDAVPPDPTTEEVPYTTPGIRFKIFKTFLTEEQMKEPISNVLIQISNSIGEQDGYTVYPMAYLNYYANGKSGNDFGLEIDNDLLRDAQTDDGRRYQLNMLRKTSSGSTYVSGSSEIPFSFNPTAKVSLYVSTLEGLQAAYSNLDSLNREKEVRLEYFSKNYAKLQADIQAKLDQINTIIEDQSLTPIDGTIYREVNASDVDFINAVNKQGLSYDAIVMADDSAPITTGVYFEHGSEGSFDDPTKTEAEIEGIKNDLLISFFNADIDTPTITDVLLCDAGITYDANYPMNVKRAMAGLTKYRPDIAVVFDCNFTTSLQQAVATAKTIKEFVSAEGSEKYAIVPHCGTTVDLAVNQRVTATYDFAAGFTALYRNRPFAIFAAYDRDAGCVKTMLFDWVVSTGKPTLVNKDLATENNMYFAINMGKAVPVPSAGNLTNMSVYYYANSNLYQPKTSKVAEFRNGIIINDLKRLCKLVLIKYNYTDREAATSIKFATEEMETKIKARYPNHVVISVSLYQTRNDTITNTCTCEITVGFPNIFETFSCKITATRTF